MVGNLLSRLTDDVPMGMATPDHAVAPAFAQTPLADYVGFPSLLPVLFHRDRVLTAAPNSGCLDANGRIDFRTHDRFVFALGGFSPDGQPAWTTTLVRREFFLTPHVQQSIALNLPLPITELIMGGRNGVLIAPNHDPITEEALDALFATPRGRAYGYAERIRYTPPELRGDFHTRAYTRWLQIQMTRRQAPPDANTPIRPEPAPNVDNHIWKRWLKERREHPQSEGNFIYPGIPLVTSSYQTVHVEGAKALLSFIPRRTKGGFVRGMLRDAFLNAAAALLSVPERYQNTLNQLEQDIAPERLPTPIYNEKEFGTANQLGISEVAAFLATVGVTTAEAEQWRPWAAAYIDMELEKHPDSDATPMLKEARESARDRITKDPKWVLTSVHPSAPGYYNPERERARATRNPRGSRGKTRQAEAGPSSANRSNSALRPAHPDDTEDGNVQLHYDNNQDEDT